VEDLIGKVCEVHASRLWFYNTSSYVPKQHEERLFRQHWSGFELDSVANVDQDENGNLIVFVRWYGFPDDDPTELTVTQMLDGGHLLLDKYLEDNKEDIRPAIYTAFKQRIHDYQKALENTSLISVESDSTPDSYWKRSLGDFRALRYRYHANPPDNFTRDAFCQDLDDLLFSVNELTVNASTKWITIPCFSPTYIRGWTAQETTTLHRLLQFMKRSDWSFVMKYLPSKTLKQIRYKAKTLRPIERRPLAPHESLEITFHRDLRFTAVYRSTLALVNDFLADLESDLRASLNAKIFQFHGYTFTEDKPNYFRCEQFVYRHVPVNSTPLLAQVEDMSIRHLTDATRIDILYVDPFWERGEDYGKRTLLELFNTLQNYPCSILAIWTVNFILVDLVNMLAESNFEVIHTLDWIKLTSRENLLKTKGYYLQHCKETLIIARRQDVRVGDVSSSSCDRLSPDFIQERQVLAGAKPQSVMKLLETWFDKATLKVELYARHNNLRTDWISVGNELHGPGLHAVIVPFSDIPIKYRPL